MMGQQWCKVASNLDTNSKIRRAGRNGREVFLFALRRNAEPGNPRPGTIPASDLEPWFVADLLMMPESDASDGVLRAVTAGLLERDDDVFVIIGWEESGWGKESGSAERMRKLRERQKSVTGDVTSDGHGVTTPPQPPKPRKSKKNGAIQTAIHNAPQVEFTPESPPPSIANPSPHEPVTGETSHVTRSDIDQSRSELDQIYAPPSSARDARARDPREPSTGGSTSTERWLVLPSWEGGVYAPVQRPRDLGLLAEAFWFALQRARDAIGAELGIAVIPLPQGALHTFGSEPKGFRDLRDRIRAEGQIAPMVCTHVLENLVANARDTTSLEWLSEKVFGEGAWMRARDRQSRGAGRAPPRASGAVGAAAARSDHAASDEPVPFGDDVRSSNA
jgi:hypothetical protein